MSEATETPAKEKKKPAAPKGPNFSRKTLRDQWRKKLRDKIHNDPEFAKTFFEGKSKRSAERKVAFKKRHAKK